MSRQIFYGTAQHIVDRGNQSIGNKNAGHSVEQLHGAEACGNFSTHLAVKSEQGYIFLKYLLGVASVFHSPASE